MDRPSVILTELSDHYDSIRNIHMRDLFMQDPDRGKTFSIELEDIFIDYSKNIITRETLKLLLNYLKKIDARHFIKAMFNGEKINTTENRSVLHTALRSRPQQKLVVDNVNIIEQVHVELKKIKQFTAAIQKGTKRGWTNKAFDTFVNIGIGGSYLGPKMVVDALTDYRNGNTQSFFISNIDFQQIETLKKKINPQTTLFIISSKSFTTIETLTNTDSIKTWLQESGCTQINKHFVAVTANNKSAINYGIEASNIFNTWDWVGGRFSLWSAIGLSIALAVGYDNFQNLHTGAREIDEHFSQAPMDKNAPIILALLDFWYSNFFNAETHAFIPYDEALRYFPDYLSQLFMESNGKSTDLSGHVVDYTTMPIIWGASGINAQHAFFQLLHQGTHSVPVDFLAPLSKQGNQKHHKLLLASCLAQSQALMQGEHNTESHRHFPGNKPSTTLLYSELNPKTLGALIALYEHRTFVQGLLWRVNSFDQWGVELGKNLAKGIYENLLEKGSNNEAMDSSTKNLVDIVKQNN